MKPCSLSNGVEAEIGIDDRGAKKPTGVKKLCDQRYPRLKSDWRNARCWAVAPCRGWSRHKRRTFEKMFINKPFKAFPGRLERSGSFLFTCCFRFSCCRKCFEQTGRSFDWLESYFEMIGTQISKRVIYTSGNFNWWWMKSGEKPT